MLEIWKPSREELQPLIDEACKDQGRDEWITRLLDGIKGVIQRDPRRYRGYGPYWFLLKKMFIEKEFFEFGESLDLEWVESLDYGDDAFNLAAAFVYEDVRFDTVNVYDSVHTMATGEDGSVEYISADEEMEQLALGGGAG